MNACKVLELAKSNDISKIIEMAKQEISEIATKEKHGASNLKRFKLIVKYLKDAEKFNYKLGKVWTENNLQCFASGCTAFLLKNHFEELPISEESIINLHDCMRSAYTRQLIEFNIADVKAKLKIFKSEHKRSKDPCFYELGESLYNAQYLIDCYTILGGEDIKFYIPKNGELIPGIFENENGKAIILPVKRNKNK